MEGAEGWGRDHTAFKQDAFCHFQLSSRHAKPEVGLIRGPDSGSYRHDWFLRWVGKLSTLPPSVRCETDRVIHICSHHTSSLIPLGKRGNT